jgi:hypothetical protein
MRLMRAAEYRAKRIVVESRYRANEVAFRLLLNQLNQRPPVVGQPAFDHFRTKIRCVRRS